MSLLLATDQVALYPPGKADPHGWVEPGGPRPYWSGAGNLQLVAGASDPAAAAGGGHGPQDPAAEANRAAWNVLSQWTKPWLCAFSDGDPITAGADASILRRVPGTAGMPHTTITGAGHFLQEDRGPELARAVAGFVAATPLS